jgi:hypothetical protein
MLSDICGVSYACLEATKEQTWKKIDEKYHDPLDFRVFCKNYNMKGKKDEVRCTRMRGRDRCKMRIKL